MSGWAAGGGSALLGRCSRGAPRQGSLQSPHAGFLTNLMLTRAGKGSRHVLLLPVCSDGDAHKQQQTPAHFFNERKFSKINECSSGCNVSTLPRISAILLVLKLSVLLLPDFVCLLYVSGRQASMVKNCTKQDASKAMLYMEHMHRCTLSYQVDRLLDPGQLRAGFFLAPEACTPSPRHPFGKQSYSACVVPAALPVVELAAPQ